MHLVEGIKPSPIPGRSRVHISFRTGKPPIDLPEATHRLPIKGPSGMPLATLPTRVRYVLQELSTAYLSILLQEEILSG